MSSTRGLALLGAALAVAALFGCDDVVSPPRFPHEAHLTSDKCGEEGQPDCPSCTSCHGGINRAEAQAIPAASVCSDCHGQAGESATMRILLFVVFVLVALLFLFSDAVLDTFLGVRKRRAG